MIINYLEREGREIAKLKMDKPTKEVVFFRIKLSDKLADVNNFVNHIEKDYGYVCSVDFKGRLVACYKPLE